MSDTYMASLSLSSSLSLASSSRTVCLSFPTNSCNVCSTKTASFKCMVAINHVTKTPKQSLYPPNLWDYHHVKSLTTHYTRRSIVNMAKDLFASTSGDIHRNLEKIVSIMEISRPSVTNWKLNLEHEESYRNQVEKLKDKVKDLINAEMKEPLAKLELIDSVQRLGLKHHFEKEIKKALDIVYKYENNNNIGAWSSSDDLFATALRFRLLRQHGYDAPQGVFVRFTDEKGNFKAGLSEDVKGLLSLYEASFLGFEDENIMKEAKTFAEVHLKNIVTTKVNLLSPEMQRKLMRALDMPLHWRLPRLEARWFIDTFAQEHNTDLTLLQLAKLDYNILQSVYQEEAYQVSSWWVDKLGLNKLSIVIRDRLMESYFWSNGMVSGAEYGASRMMTAKVASLITCLDDIYDVCCSPQELQLITDFVDRWDMSGIDKLPYNVRIFLLALFNTTNDMGYWTIKEHGFNIIPYFSKQWANLCKAFLKEAMWSHRGYKPTLEEYLENAVVSASGLLLLFCTYFGTADKIDKEALTYLEKLPTIMWCSSMIFRLTNDLAASSGEMARDDVNAVGCYMNDTDATEEVAREYIDGLIHKAWKTMNRNVVMQQSHFLEPFLSANLNLARTSQCMYQHGDGHSFPGGSTKDYLNDLLVQPFII